MRTHIQNSFDAGELSPKMYGRQELDQYKKGLKTCLNCVVHAQGPVQNRSGFKYIASVKTASKSVRLIPFEFSEDQAYILEFGDEYMRVYTDGGQVADGASPYEIATPYGETDLDDLDWAQSKDVMFIVHPSYAPRKLSRTGHTSWTLTEIEFAWPPFIDQNQYPSLGITPSDVTGSITLSFADLITNGDFATGISDWTDLSDTGGSIAYDAVNDNMEIAGDGTTDYGYAECSVDTAPGQEYSLSFLSSDANLFVRVGSASGEEDIVSDIDKAIGANLVSFVATTSETFIGFRVLITGPATIDDVTCYPVMFVAASVGGHIALSDGYCKITAFTDTHTVTATVVETLTAADETSEWAHGAFSATQGYPSCVSFYENRLVLAATEQKPATIWLSKIVYLEDFSVSDTLVDTDAVMVTISSDKQNAIKWLIPGHRLFIGTAGAEYWMTGSTINSAITPSSVLVRKETTWGSADVPPVNVGGTILFVQRHAKKLRELYYSYDDDAFLANDLLILADHMTESATITDMDFQPDMQILWCTRSDGVLLGFSYLRENKVLAWHRHTTGASGEFESVAVIPGESGDEVWAVVKRTIEEATVRYVEQLQPLFNDTDTDDAFFVDSGLSYSGVAVSSVSGLDHLEGEEVAILVNGAVHPSKTVASGEVALEWSGTNIHAGLKITGDIETLEPSIPTQSGESYGHTKRIDELVVSLYQTLGLQVGPDTSSLDIVPFRDSSVLMNTVELFSGQKRIPFDGSESDVGETFVCLRQDQPLPITLRSIVSFIDVGDR